MYVVVSVSFFKGIFCFYLFSQLSEYFHTWFYIFWFGFSFWDTPSYLSWRPRATWIDPCARYICQGRCGRCQRSLESSCWEDVFRASPLEPLPHRCEHMKISLSLCSFNPWLTELYVSPPPPCSYSHFSLLPFAYVQPHPTLLLHFHQVTPDPGLLAPTTLFFLLPEMKCLTRPPRTADH